MRPAARPPPPEPSAWMGGSVRWPPSEDSRWGPSLYPPFQLPAAPGEARDGTTAVSSSESRAAAAGASEAGAAELPRHVVKNINAGITHERRGELDAAAAKYRLAQASAVRVGNVQGEALACGHLALVAKSLGDDFTARQCLADYVSLTEALGMQRMEKDTHTIQGAVEQGVEDFDSWILSARVAE